MTIDWSHNPSKAPSWLLDMNEDNRMINIRRRGKPPAEGFSDVVFAATSRDHAAAIRDELCDRGPDKRYRLRHPLTIAQAREGFARAAGRVLV